MDNLIRAISKMVTNMERVSIHGQFMKYILAISPLTRDKDWECIIGQMVGHTGVNGEEIG